MHAGEYRPKPEPPSPERLNAMTKQCRNRGGGGCNCDEECKVDEALTWTELQQTFHRGHQTIQRICDNEESRKELNRHGIITEKDADGFWVVRAGLSLIYQDKIADMEQALKRTLTPQHSQVTEETK